MPVVLAELFIPHVPVELLMFEVLAELLVLKRP